MCFELVEAGENEVRTFLGVEAINAGVFVSWRAKCEPDLEK